MRWTSRRNKLSLRKPRLNQPESPKIKLSPKFSPTKSLKNRKKVRFLLETRRDLDKGSPRFSSSSKTKSRLGLPLLVQPQSKKRNRLPLMTAWVHSSSFSRALRGWRRPRTWSNSLISWPTPQKTVPSQSKLRKKSLSQNFLKKLLDQLTEPSTSTLTRTRATKNCDRCQARLKETTLSNKTTKTRLRRWQRKNLAFEPTII